MTALSGRRGLTLLEILVVIAILGVVIALTLPAVVRVRDSAARCQCASNLRQIGLALHGYHDTHQHLPPGVSYHNGSDPHPFMSWNTRLLPHIEQDSLWREAVAAFAREKSFLINPPHTGLGTPVRLFGCPADSRTLHSQELSNGWVVAFTAYLGIEGIDQVRKDGVLYLDSRVRFANITDGLSTTLTVGERPPSADGVLGWWYAGEGQFKDGSADMVLGVRERNAFTYAADCPAGPYRFGPGRVQNQCDALHFWSPHVGGGAHFLFADGAVRFLPYSSDPLLPALATRSGGEPASWE